MIQNQRSLKTEAARHHTRVSVQQHGQAAHWGEQTGWGSQPLLEAPAARGQLHGPTRNQHLSEAPVSRGQLHGPTAGHQMLTRPQQTPPSEKHSQESHLKPACSQKTLLSGIELSGWACSLAKGDGLSVSPDSSPPRRPFPCPPPPLAGVGPGPSDHLLGYCFCGVDLPPPGEKSNFVENYWCAQLFSVITILKHVGHFDIPVG